MDIYMIEGNPSNNIQAITLAYEKLFSEGNVKESFLSACLAREETYPTGLPTDIPVAVPHTDACHVTRAAICGLRPDAPIIFHDMEEPDDTVEAEYVFVMALKEDGDHLEMLKKLIGVAQNDALLSSWKDLPASEIRVQLEKCIKGE